MRKGKDGMSPTVFSSPYSVVVTCMTKSSSLCKRLAADVVFQ